MAPVSLLITLMSLVVLINAEAHLHTSIQAIKTAFHIDRQIADRLTKVEPSGFEEEIVINRYLKEHRRLDKIYQWKSKSVTDDEAEIVAKNPIFAFQIMRRLSVDYEAISQRIKETFPKHINESLSVASESMVGIGRGIITLQTTHQLLPAAELRKGKIRHLKIPGRLTVGDCITLSVIATKMEAGDVALEWTQEAHRLCEITAKKTKTEDSDGKNLCSKSTQPLLAAAQLRLEQWLKKGGVVSDRDTLCNRASLHQQPSFNDEKISTKTLYCTYLRLPKEPDITIQRYRIEIQSEKPVIVTIHNVITVKEADYMVKQAENKLCQSPTEEKQPVDKRIGQAVWFTDHHDKIFARISERVNHITGLSTKGSEIRDFQVVNYGIGDALNKEEELEQIWGNTETPENNIATFILYLSDVELGGSTYFPRLGLTIEPKQGSATMVYNSDGKGPPNKDAIHGGCPVILGNKWVANKWM